MEHELHGELVERRIRRRWTDTSGTAAALFGGTTAGTVTVSGNDAANALIFNTAGYSLSGGTVTLAGSTPTITMNATSATIGSLLAGTSGLTTAGSGTLYLSNAANSFTNGVFLDGGTLNFTTSALNSNVIKCNGGTLQWAANNTQDISAKINISGSTQVANLDPNGNNVTFATALSGSGGVDLTGSNGGSLQYNNANNTYTGGTTVSSGTLTLNGGNGNNGAGCIRGSLTIQPGGTLNVLGLGDGNSVLGGTSTAASNLTTLNINNGTLLNSNTTGQSLTGAAITMTGGTIATANTNGWSFYTNGASGSTNLTVLPSTNTALISAPLGINQSTTPTFNIGAGTTASAVDLLVSGALTFNNGGMDKEGNGTMSLTNSANSLSKSYSLVIGAGNLIVAATNALGSSNPSANGHAGRRQHHHQRLQSHAVDCWRLHHLQPDQRRRRDDRGDLHHRRQQRQQRHLRPDDHAQPVERRPGDRRHAEPQRLGQAGSAAAGRRHGNLRRPGHNQCFRGHRQRLGHACRERQRRPDHLQRPRVLTLAVRPSAAGPSRSPMITTTVPAQSAGD